MDIHKSIAIVPGSFDPITNGHVNIIDRAAEMYDIVYVAVMINEAKRYMFSLDERKAIVEACFIASDNIRVISSDGWLWALARSLGASAIVKGYRNEADLEYEKKMAEFNEEKYPECKTVLLKADESLTDMSSTYIRSLIEGEEALDGLIPNAAIEVIKSIK